MPVAILHHCAPMLGRMLLYAQKDLCLSYLQTEVERIISESLQSFCQLV